MGSDAYVSLRTLRAAQARQKAYVAVVVKSAARMSVSACCARGANSRHPERAAHANAAISSSKSQRHTEYVTASVRTPAIAMGRRPAQTLTPKALKLAALSQ